MPRLAAIYRALTQVRNPAVDQALAAALPTAKGGALRGIVAAILERRDAAGELGLVHQFHRFAPDTQATITSQTGQLFRAIREAAGSRDPQTATNAIELVRRAGSAKLAYLMVEQLRHGSPAQKDAAAACLLELCHRASDGASAQFLMSTIYEAVAAFGQHRRADVLLAAAELIPRGLREAPRLLADSQHAAYEPWQDLLRQADSPAVQRTLLLMLSRAGLSDAAGEGLRKAVATPDASGILANTHYLALPAVARGLAGLKAPAGLTRGHSITGDASRGLPALLAAWPGERAERIAALGRLHDHPELHTRIAALRTLIRMAPRASDPAVAKAVAEFRLDADPAAARIVATYLVRGAGAELPRALAELVASPHPGVRRIAAQRLGPRSFARLWESWPKLEIDKRLAAGRALIKLDPLFHRLLGEKLAIAERNTRVRALTIIADLGQGGFFEHALTRLTAAADERVASIAVRALSAAPGTTVDAALAAALDHADARVRANAVEALAARQNVAHVDRLLRMTGDDHGRPRANALGALLDIDTRVAMEGLRRMLADPRAAHRVSALWLVQAAGVVDVARQVAELAITDPDREVQRRARQAVKRLVSVLSPAVPEADEASPDDATLADAAPQPRGLAA